MDVTFSYRAEHYSPFFLIGMIDSVNLWQGFKFGCQCMIDMLSAAWRGTRSRPDRLRSPLGDQGRESCGPSGILRFSTGGSVPKKKKRERRIPVKRYMEHLFSSVSGRRSEVVPSGLGPPHTVVLWRTPSRHGWSTAAPSNSLCHNHQSLTAGRRTGVVRRGSGCPSVHAVVWQPRFCPPFGRVSRIIYPTVTVWPLKFSCKPYHQGRTSLGFPPTIS